MIYVISFMKLIFVIFCCNHPVNNPSKHHNKSITIALANDRFDSMTLVFSSWFKTIGAAITTISNTQLLGPSAGCQRLALSSNIRSPRSSFDSSQTVCSSVPLSTLELLNRTTPLLLVVLHRFRKKNGFQHHTRTHACTLQLIPRAISVLAASCVPLAWAEVQRLPLHILPKVIFCASGVFENRPLHAVLRRFLEATTTATSSRVTGAACTQQSPLIDEEALNAHLKPLKRLFTGSRSIV